MIGLITVVGGNLHNVRSMLERFDLGYIDINDSDIPDDIETVILPGVGSFPVVMQKLADSGLVEVLRARAGKDFRLIGVCSGMQILATTGVEDTQTDGLGLIPGCVKRLKPADPEVDARIPVVGWTKVVPVEPWAEADAYFYFTHSYCFHADDEAHVAVWAKAQNIPAYPAVIKKGNIYGMQFHPEVSSDAGMGMMRMLLECEA